jgi:UDP-N-acetylmuramate--alanine ligase
MGIFQPHLYTRTRDFYKEFADSLSLLDDVVLLDIYPAREEPIPGVTSKLIYDCLEEHVNKQMCRKEDLLEVLRRADADVFILLGAGDAEACAPQITEVLKTRC